MSDKQPKPDPVKKPGEPVHRVDRKSQGLDGEPANQPTPIDPSTPQPVNDPNDPNDPNYPVSPAQTRPSEQPEPPKTGNQPTKK